MLVWTGVSIWKTTKQKAEITLAELKACYRRVQGYILIWERWKAMLPVVIIVGQCHSCLIPPCLVSLSNCKLWFSSCLHNCLVSREDFLIRLAIFIFLVTMAIMQHCIPSKKKPDSILVLIINVTENWKKKRKRLCFLICYIHVDIDQTRIDKFMKHISSISLICFVLEIESCQSNANWQIHDAHFNFSSISLICFLLEICICNDKYLPNNVDGWCMYV